MMPRVIAARDEAERKAWDSLARYKFCMFGYHAAAWVKFNSLLDVRSQAANPFRSLVHLARQSAPLDGPALDTSVDQPELVGFEANP